MTRGRCGLNHSGACLFFVLLHRCQRFLCLLHSVHFSLSSFLEVDHTALAQVRIHPIFTRMFHVSSRCVFL